MAKIPKTPEPIAPAQPERPGTGWYGEDYREIIGRPDLSDEWKVPDPMQGDNRPHKPEE
jgi:hypothetical protein